MKKEPISGLSDQRYFHVAIFSRKRSLSLKWIWDALERDAHLSSGRLPSASSGPSKQESRTITESPTYAGSPESVKELATPGNAGTCDYDIIGGMTSEFVMLGSGYSRLTHILARRLVRQSVMERGWFLTPKLDAIASMLQSRSSTVAKKAAKLDVALSATGLTAIYRGCKNFQGFRFAGADVFRDGFMEMVVGWLENNAEKADEVADSSVSPFGYKMMRINAIDRNTGSSASVTLRPDGSYKFWVRKGASNLQELTAAVNALAVLGLLEEKTEVPKWADEDEL